MPPSTTITNGSDGGTLFGDWVDETFDSLVVAIDHHNQLLSENIIDRLGATTTMPPAKPLVVGNNELTSLGFSPAADHTSPRIIMSVQGLEKQGKTHLALSAPGPIAYFNSDIGMEGVVGKFLTHKQIHVFDVDTPSDSTKATAEWDRVVKAYRAVLASPISQVRSVVFDTETELWELIRLARFGKLTQVMPHNYGPVNAEYRRLIREAYDSDKNLILLRKMKPLYINDKRTKDYEASGFGDMKFLSQVNVQVYRDDPWTDENGVLVPGEFHVYVKDCRQNENLQGTDLAGPLATFQFLASMIVAGTGPEDWE